MLDATKVRNLLVADPRLAAAGTRIYAERDVPPPGYTPKQGACITFTRRGGIPEYASPVLLGSYQFKCYAENEVKASSLDAALYAVLQDAKGEGVLYAANEVLGQLLREPDTDWVFVLSFYTIVTRV